MKSFKEYLNEQGLPPSTKETIVDTAQMYGIPYDVYGPWLITGNPKSEWWHGMRGWVYDPSQGIVAMPYMTPTERKRWLGTEDPSVSAFNASLRDKELAKELFQYLALLRGY